MGLEFYQSAKARVSGAGRAATARRLGGRQEISVDVRVIAATNVNPQEAVNNGKLREDLFYRLNVFAIDLPPLRDRREDIPLLVQTFLTEFNRTNGKGIRAVDQEAMYILEHYPWVAGSLYNAFTESQNRAHARMFAQ